VIENVDGVAVLVTVHPSYLLRIPDAEAKLSERGRFVADLRAAADYVS
jgi:DNA polymerase